MTKTVVATFETVSQDFPAEKAVGAYYHVVLTEQSTGATIVGKGDIGQTSISIPDVPAGSYVGVIVLVDAAGAQLSSPVASSPVAVVDAPATVVIGVPTSLSLSAA